MAYKRVNFFISTLCCVLLAGSTGCRNSEAELLTFVPSDSAAVLIVNWTSIRNDNSLRSMIKGKDFEGQMRRFGVESSTVEELVVFGAMNSSGALLLRGTFDRRKVAERLKSSGWSESKSDGKKIYVNGNDYVCMPSDGILAAGPQSGVVAAIEAGGNSRGNLTTSSVFKSIKAEIPSGKSPIRAFLIAPEGTLEMADTALSVTAGAMSLFGFGEIGAILNKMNVASGAGFSIARASTAQKFSVNFCVMMRDEQTATIAAGALNVMKSLSATVGNPDEKENLRNFSVTQRKKILSIKMEMPGEALMPLGSS